MCEALVHPPFPLEVNHKFELLVTRSLQVWTSFALTVLKQNFSVHAMHIPTEMLQMTASATGDNVDNNKDIEVSSLNIYKSADVAEGSASKENVDIKDKARSAFWFVS
jgi:hypothetical protein